MEEGKKQHKSKKATIVLGLIGIVILISIVVVQFNKKNSELQTYQLGTSILSYEDMQNHYIGVNGDQIIFVTEDGVIAYNPKGEEVWRDTLSLQGVEVVQRGSYFAVNSKQGKKISIFGEKGKTGEITTQYPILFFSINENGDVVIAEEMQKGHVVSAYSSRGVSLGVKRVTYTDTAGYPIAAEMSPDSTQLVISYMNLNGPTLASDLVAIDIQKEMAETRDDLLYGMQEKSNLVFQITFLSNRQWVAVGDRRITFYSTTGQTVIQRNEIYPKFSPYLVKLPKSGSYLPVVATDGNPFNAVHKKEILHLFDGRGEEVSNIELKEEVTYYYATDRGVIIGQGRLFTEYNKLGVPLMEFQGTQDIKKVQQLGNRYIAITKDQVFLLKRKGIEESK